jgi:hypothetical protein
MTNTPRRHSAPDPLAWLASLPRRRRNAILAVVSLIRVEEAEDVAIFLKGHHPEITDRQIARACGVSRAKVARWKRYQAMKPTLADIAHLRRQPTKWRRMKGDRWPLDHPDRV